jgi:chromate reductase, NAD(P)H dehydrogenase (quinone)
VYDTAHTDPTVPQNKKNVFHAAISALTHRKIISQRYRAQQLLRQRCDDLFSTNSFNREEIFMTRYQIAVVVGSLRRASFNRQLASAIIKLASSEFEFTQVQIGDLPLYNQDDDATPHENVKRLKAEISAAQGLLFVTPEYNRSISGVLKNAIDHGSRPYGQSVWAGKPAGVIGASVGVIGTAMAQQHLRNILAYLDVPTMGQSESFIHANNGLFDGDGNIGQNSLAFMQTWMDVYCEWIKTHAAARA